MPHRSLSDVERLARLESMVENNARNISKLEEAVQAIFKAIKEIRDDVAAMAEARARDRGFFAGMMFAYGTISAIIGGAIGTGIDYVLHK